MTTTNRLTDELNDMGEAMQELAKGEGNEEVDLKKAREGIESLHTMSERADSQDAFHSYMLWTFLDDLWRNVTMVPSTRLDDDRIENLFEKIGTNLQLMGEHYENHDEGDLVRFNGVFTEVYSEYIEWLDRKEEESNVGAAQ